MASLFRDSDSFTVCFRVAGRQFRRSLKTDSEREAKIRLGNIESTLFDIEKGKLVIPEGADIGQFVLSDGKMTGKLVLPHDYTLEKMLELYLEGRQSLEHDSKKTLQIHVNHLLRIIGRKKIFQAIRHPDLQGYVNERVKEVTGGTAEKEIKTFRAAWRWAKDQDLINKEVPTAKIEYPKAKPKPAFQTWTQIERAIARGGMDDDEVAELWHFLWLDSAQVNELLDFVKDHAAHPFVYPMFVMVAHTGCRRSEMMRSRVADFDFEAGMVSIREKKKDKETEETIRKVSMSPLLTTVMRTWFIDNQSAFTICDGKKMSGHQARHHFEHVLKGSKWEVLRGFHVLRHSFISNFARKGIDQRITDSFVGHTTDAMREHYRHLHPEQLGNAINKVFAA